jgi:hypothetical protein
MLSIKAQTTMSSAGLVGLFPGLFIFITVGDVLANVAVGAMALLPARRETM